MNIFVLDKDPIKAAQMHCDKHVVKMILETAQMLSTAVRHYYPEIPNGEPIEGYTKLYRAAYKHHPCTKWTLSNSTRFYWLRDLGAALLNEYYYRYGASNHKCAPVIDYASFPVFDAMEDTPPLEPFALAMPEEYKCDDAVQAYRDYYRNEKKELLIYKVRKPPEWVSDLATYKPL